MTDDAELEGRVRAALDAIGVPYEVMLIDPEFADTAAFCARYEIPLERSANTIVVASKKEPKRYCACVVRATARLDVNHVVRRLLGVPRLSFAGPEETRAVTGMQLGGVTPLALPPELPIYVDGKLLALDWVILGGGSRSSKIKAPPELLRRLPNVEIVPDLAHESPR